MRHIGFMFPVLILSACTAIEVADPNEPVLVALDPATPFAETLGRFDSRNFVPFHDTAAPRWIGPRAAAEQLVAAGAARFFEPVVDYTSDFVPADPRIKDQWALADIDAPSAWPRTGSARSVTVAVVDSGIQPGHPDLEAAIWINEGEVPGNGLDDDGNGYVDDVHGWDFVDDDADPSPEGTDAEANHGTHVAGIIGATQGNHLGISGVAPGVMVMPVRVMSGGHGSSDHVADGIDYAVRNGARVVNLSLGGAYSQLIDEALARASKAGVLVVAAAGNDGGSEASFPASSRVSGVLGVAATDSRRQLATFSNRGFGVDLSAPGVGILSTYGPRSYSAMSGTSMAAPHVAGAVALRLASRGRAGQGSVQAMLDALPRGPSGLPRLDLPAMIEASKGLPSDEQPHLSCSRTRLAFHSGSALRRPPPPRVVAIASPMPMPFTVEVPAFARVGSCRSAPCRLSVMVASPSGLKPGDHTGTLWLRPADGSKPLSIELDYFVNHGTDSVELETASQLASAAVSGEELEVGLGEPFSLRLIHEGRHTSAHWSIDGAPARGTELRGSLMKPGSYMVRGSTDAGEEISLRMRVAEGGSGAATGVGVPHGG